MRGRWLAALVLTLCGGCSHDIDYLLVPGDAGMGDVGADAANNADVGTLDSGADAGLPEIVIESAPNVGDPCPPVMGVRNCSGVVLRDRWVLWRFVVPVGGMTVTHAGFNGQVTRGSFFAAFVPLRDLSDLPLDPQLLSGPAETPTVFTPPETDGMPVDIIANVGAVELESGPHALVFGTDAHGALSGSAMVISGPDDVFDGEYPTSFRPDPAMPEWTQQASNVRIFVHGMSAL